MRRITGLAMATLLVLGAAACGSDDDTSAGDTTTTAPDDTTTTADPGSGDDGGDTDGTDGGVGLGLLDEDCQFLVAGAYLNPLVQATTGVGEDYDEIAQRLEDVREKAPEEIQDAMATISAAYSELAEALKDVDFDGVQSLQDPDVQSALQDLEDVIDEEYQQATAVVGTYVEENCSP